MNSLFGTKNAVYLKLLIAIAGLLLIPLIFTLAGSGEGESGWHWTISDFLVAGMLLYVLSASFVFIKRNTSKKKRIIYFGLDVLLIAWLWVVLAVGLFTSWGS